jgi:D-alanyl-lipoteichoic acid acyltransferase DltB (MBOAT superfamily)
MNVTSLTFAAFILLTVLLYHRLPKRYKLAWLAFVSVVFVASWSISLLGILVVLIGLNYFIALRLNAASEKKRSIWLITGIAVNIGALLVFRYSAFFMPELTNRLQTILIDHQLDIFVLMAPVGLGFFIVQGILYQVDVYYKRLAAERSFVLVFLYLLYFPKFLSGPIERPKQFMERLKTPAAVDWDTIKKSFVLIMFGLVRKKILADPLSSLLPDTLFTAPMDVAWLRLMSCLLGYAFVIYNDFAGYSNIVLGISQLFGIQINPNFNLPYLSSSFTEFWTRWHISLSTALRDYIYFPFSRWLAKYIPNRNNVVNILFPPAITMLASGLWHGLSLNMIFWGGMHGIYLVIERVIRLKPVEKTERKNGFKTILNICIVFVFTNIAWVPFRLPLTQAFHFYAALLPTIPRVRSYGVILFDIVNGITIPGTWSAYFPDLRVLVMIVLAIFLDLYVNRLKGEVQILNSPRWVQITALTTAIILFLFLSLATYQAPFIYQGF